MRLIGTAIFMTALWLLMSGIYKPLVLFFGAVSIALAVYVTHRADRIDGQPVHLYLKPVATVGYIAWLFGEIAKANWAVTKVILASGDKTRQHLFATPFTQKTELGQVIFANSITLTPGTITVQLDDGEFLVHALDYADGDDDAALADMDARVTATEAVAS